MRLSQKVEEIIHLQMTASQLSLVSPQDRAMHAIEDLRNMTVCMKSEELDKFPLAYPD